MSHQNGLRNFQASHVTLHPFLKTLMDCLRPVEESPIEKASGFVQFCKHAKEELSTHSGDAEKLKIDAEILCRCEVVWEVRSCNTGNEPRT